ncbi:MAG: phosphoribosyltransferase family protein [Nitrospiraceae bacterium]|nr:phosphoribosyltransferase family protein [Nitrospiraceae bacterium]
MIFQDRTQAGRKLAQELKSLGLIDPLVLALPRGGVPVGRAVSNVLACALDVIPLMKIPIPWSPEASYGVVAMDGTPALNMPLVHRLELSERELEVATSLVRHEAERREQLYRQGKPYPELENRSVILVDDGLASGYSMLAAVNFVKKRRPRAVIVAAPIASDSAVRMLAADRDVAAIVTLVNDAEPFFSLAAYYKEFKTLTDGDVLRELV